MAIVVGVVPGIHEHELITECVVELLNITVVVSSSTVRCGMCKQSNDLHTLLCPVPALEEWLSAQ